ncbi:hypothetical protein IIC68_01950 [archaeon]|nr:hypothetical protein [archaeon]
MLDGQTFGTGGTTGQIQNSHVVKFLGTTVPTGPLYVEVSGIRGELEVVWESNGLNSNAWSYYVPKSTDFNNDSANSASEAYFVAEFQVNSATASEDFNIYVDTSDATTVGPFPSTNLSAYSDDVKYTGSPSWTLQGGTQGTYLSAGYTDEGVRAMLISDGATVKITMPQLAEKVDIIVYGKAVDREVAGGETLTLAPGQTGTTDSGTTVTVEAVNGGSCGAIGGGDVACSATPTSYSSPAAVGTLVYLDTDNASGTNIIIGGHIVNQLASSLADELTAPGQMVARVDAASGDIFLAGYTAADTGKAVQELIDDIDSWA